MIYIIIGGYFAAQRIFGATVDKTIAERIKTQAERKQALWWRKQCGFEYNDRSVKILELKDGEFLEIKKEL